MNNILLTDLRDITNEAIELFNEKYPDESIDLLDPMGTISLDQIGHTIAQIGDKVEITVTLPFRVRELHSQAEEIRDILYD
jgi:hypothetical protein